VIQPFLLLRVKAVYLITTNADPEWTGYQEQYEALTAGVTRWTSLVAGHADLEAAAAQVQSYLKDYCGAGDRFHGAILATRAADELMVSSARDVGEKCAQLGAALQNDLNTLLRSSNALMIALAAGALLLSVLMGILVTRGIVRPLNRVIAGLRAGPRRLRTQPVRCPRVRSNSPPATANRLRRSKRRAVRSKRWRP